MPTNLSTPSSSRRDSNRRLSILGPVERSPDDTARFLSKWPTRCLDHEDVITSFCVNHDRLICSVCLLSNHKECGSIMGLTETSKDIRRSRDVTIVESKLKKLRENYEQTYNQQVEVLSSLTQTDKAFVKQVRAFREEINSVLDKLENDVLARKDNLVTQRRNAVKDHKHKCKNAMAMLETFTKELDRIFLGTDEQMLMLSIKKSQTVLTSYENQLSRIRAEPNLFNMEFQPNHTIDKFFITLKEFGTMRLDQASKEIVAKDNKPSTARSVTERRLSLNTSERVSLRSELGNLSERRKSILPDIGKDSLIKLGSSTPIKTRKPIANGEIHVTFDGDGETPFITGITFLPDDRLVLIDDANKNVKLLSSTFKPLDVMQLPLPPRDVTMIRPTTVVITIPNEKSLQFMEISKPMQLRKKLSMDIECFGIDYYENELYVTSGFSVDREIQIISLNGEVRKRVRPGIADLRYPLYVTVDGKFKTIFVTDYNHGVVGLDTNTGIVKFKCKNTDVHSYYKGVALGHKGNVMVCTWNLHGISRVHVDGRGLETLVPMPDKEGRKPQALAYSRKTSILVVSLCGGTSGNLALFRFI